MTTTFLVGLLGLVVGFLSGIAFDDARDLYRASRKERPMTPTRHSPWTRWLLSAVLVINGAMAGFLILQRADSAEFTACTGQWQEEFFTAYEARSESAAVKEIALDRVMAAVATSDRAEFREALDNYQKLRAEQVAARKANPLPPLPTRVCGEDS